MSEIKIQDVFGIIAQTIGIEMSGVKAMTEEESIEWHKHHSRTNDDGTTIISNDKIN